MPPSQDGSLLPASPTPGVGLTVRDVTKRYGDTLAADAMSLDLAPGEVLGFVGSNGAGKSTLMRIILGVLASDSGQVLWQGTPITADGRRQIGYMPEERGLYPRMRVGDQLHYLARLHGLSSSDADTSVDRWLARLGIAHYRGSEVQKLSLGNQQRVQLAAAMVHDPVLLVLDEPFSGLDPIAVDVMSQVLRDTAARGVPVIFSSHQLELVERLCDRVAIVRRGRVVAAGTVDELRSGSAMQLVIDAPGARPGWADGLAGVTVHDSGGTVTVLGLSPGTDEQAVLKAALATGPVRSFAPRQPSLAELFRHVVSEEVTA
jgi:ABC-2 type transport system ATP-binding protein